MTIVERLRQVQERDEREMHGIYEAVAAGIHPDAAATLVIGREFRLSEHVKAALKG